MHAALVVTLAVGGFLPQRWTPTQRRTRHASPLAAESLDGVGGGVSGVQSLESFFFDRCELYVRSGAGGEGAVCFTGGTRPSGGTGGDGGNVYIECSPDYTTLGHLQGRAASVRAGRGADADGRQSGAFGEHSVVRVPPNVLVVDGDTNETVAKLVTPGERVLVASGGAGGQGNGEVWRRTRRDSKARVAPGGTERRRLLLSMTLVADVGLVGLPNAGKSTLLRAVTRARPKVADYPFTTLIPNLGVTEMEAFEMRGAKPMVWLDIPGLIEGAAAGRGLGHAFLRHTERCRLLLHLIDGETCEPSADLAVINRELASYSPLLASRPQVIVLTKADLAAEGSVRRRLEELKAAAGHGRVLCVSSAERTNLKTLLARVRSLLDTLPRTEPAEAERAAAPAAADTADGAAYGGGTGAGDAAAD